MHLTFLTVLRTKENIKTVGIVLQSSRQIYVSFRPVSLIPAALPKGNDGSLCPDSVILTALPKITFGWDLLHFWE